MYYAKSPISLVTEFMGEVYMLLQIKPFLSSRNVLVDVLDPHELAGIHN
jgi:hypothetical protein